MLGDTAKMKGERSFPPETRSTSHGLSGTEYEVFLSFRGPDTRANFTDSLYHTLWDKGISVFIDKKGIDVGDEIGHEIYQAIDDSKICIPIFSTGYASSRWCLRELEHMMKRRKSHQLEVMPIFYDVEPSDVKLETGGYKDALTLHIKECGAEIVQVKLKVSYVDISDHLVGMDKSVNELVNLLNVELKDVRLIGIWGMGGIGKTTLAKAVYNELSSNFDSCSFISDIREASQGFGLLNLQRRLVSDIIGDVGDGLSSIDHGKNMIKNKFCKKKVLIFLDDVNHGNQLMALAAKKEWFGSGSRIVVTTRDKSVFTRFEDQFHCCLIYEVKELNFSIALQLFSKHAFRSNSPPNAFFSLSKKIIANTGGLPLAIEVIGSFLCGKKKESMWQDTLKKMKYSQRKDVQQSLMLSYEALDRPQQQIFLDIACFLAGKDKSYPYYMWDDCGFFPSEGIDVLLLMSLVKIGENNRLWMHDQLKDFGRSIVYEEHCKDPTKGSRLWRDQEGGSDIFQQKGIETVAAQYKRFPLPPQVLVLTSKELIKMPNIRFLNMSGCTLSGDSGELFSELRWLTWKYCPEEMQATNFCPKNLVIFDLRCSEIDECWGGWTQLKVATRLKVLDLSYCTKLKETPELSVFLSLKVLNLKGCKVLTRLSNSIGMLKYLAELDISETSIVELPNTIVILKRLKVLRMNDSRIQKLPEAIWMMEKLEEIYGERCKRLEMFPSDVVRLSFLKILKLTGTCVENVLQLPQSLVATRLEVLDLSDCRMLKETPELSVFSSLKVLNLDGCRVLTRLPNSIGMLKYLAVLDISDTSIVELPNTIVNLKNLKVLRMNNSYIQKLPKAIEMMEKLEEIYGESCRHLEMIPSDIVKLPSLKILKLTQTCVENVPKLPQCLEAGRPKFLNSSHCKMLKKTPELSAFLSLKVSILKECEELTKLFNSIGMLKYITELDVSNTSITELPNTIVNLKSLKVLRMNYSCIQKLPETIGMMEKLEEIYGERCKWLEMFPSDVVRLPSLKILKLTGTCVENVLKLPQSLVAIGLEVLDLSNCRMLKETPELSVFSSLKVLNLNGCRVLTRLPNSIGMLKYLAELDISDTSIAKLPNTIVNLKNLKVLRMNHSYIQKLPKAIGMMEKLEEIYGESCRRLEMIPSDIMRLPSLKILKLTETCVENVPELPQCLVSLCLSSHVSEKHWKISNSVATGLEVLDLSDCRMLKETPELSIFSSLKVLNLKGCGVLTRLSDSIGMLKETPKLFVFSSLKVLNLKGCRVLTRLSNSIGMLKYLAELDISDTSIAKLPNTIVNLKNLKVLRMNDSRIQKLPKAIGMMEKLEEIYGERCRRLEMIPSDIVRLPSLKILKLTETCVENVPELPRCLASLCLSSHVSEKHWKISNSVSLKNLKLCFLIIFKMLSFMEAVLIIFYLFIIRLSILKECEELTKLFNSNGMLKYITELDVSNTSIAELPNTIVNLKSLKVLMMNDSCIQKLPETIGMMEKLEKIYGKRCRRLEMFPSDVVRLPSLKILKLTGTCVENVLKLPQSLVAIRLEVLDLSDCRMLKKTPELSVFSSLKVLNLNGCRVLTRLPNSIGMLKYLAELDISDTSIAKLPNTIVNLKNLKVLRMNHSYIQKLPKAIGMMEKLEEIYGESCRRLEMIPSDIMRLPSLKILKLTETCVENVPELPQCLEAGIPEFLKLSRCGMLKETPELFAFLFLKVSILKKCEELTKLFNSIGMLKYINVLDVSNTSIAELPNTIANLKSLKVLMMNDSCIQKLPETIGMMEKLEKIYGERCRRLEIIPNDIVRLLSLKILKLTETRVVNVPKLPQSLLSLSLSSTVSEKDPEISNLVGLSELELCFPLTYIVHSPILKRASEISHLYCKLELLIITSISSYLGCFRFLHRLELKNCNNLCFVGQLPFGLIEFIVDNCRSLEVVDLSNLSNFNYLKVQGCLRLVEIQGIDRLESLERLFIERCSPLLRLPDLSTWKELWEWDVDALATYSARGKQVARHNRSQLWHLKKSL
ncbi:hypothetical protein BT93_C0926 [Corymbia citriodora subsp. variegata]|nr:hypothetical protein BT93_C0926 [Corymbia citriodora subsp. variegata]